MVVEFSGLAIDDAAAYLQGIGFSPDSQPSRHFLVRRSFERSPHAISILEAVIPTRAPLVPITLPLEHARHRQPSLRLIKTSNPNTSNKRSIASSERLRSPLRNRES